MYLAYVYVYKSMYIYIYFSSFININISLMYMNINMRVKFGELYFCLKIRSVHYLIIKASNSIAEKIKKGTNF